ncbi:MAG: hypothetical protein H7X77_02365 [Anaerolineae bacterium]|nr:hypothetical protein [Anaerolineae bacterium]
MVGTNPETGGTYSDKDAAAITKFTDCQAAKTFALQTALSRITTNPSRFAALAIEKIPNNWSDNTYGVHYVFETLAETPPSRDKIFLYAFAQLWFASVFSFAFIGLFRLRRIHLHGDNFMIMFILSTLVLHTFVEVAQRYTYAAVPVLMILGLSAMLKLREKAP